MWKVACAGKSPYRAVEADRVEATQPRPAMKPPLAAFFVNTFGVALFCRDSLELDDSAPQRDRDGLRAIACSELVHDVPDVNLHRFFRDEEAFGDIPVSISPGDLAENLRLPIGQVLVGDVLRQARRHLRRNAFRSRVNLAYHSDQLLRRRGLRQVSSCASFEGSLDFDIALESGQHDYARVGKLVPHGDQRVDATFVGSLRSMRVTSGRRIRNW